MPVYCNSNGGLPRCSVVSQIKIIGQHDLQRRTAFRTDAPYKIVSSFWCVTVLLPANRADCFFSTSRRASFVIM